MGRTLSEIVQSEHHHGRIKSGKIFVTEDSVTEDEADLLSDQFGAPTVSDTGTSAWWISKRDAAVAGLDIDIEWP